MGTAREVVRRVRAGELAQASALLTSLGVAVPNEVVCESLQSLIWPEGSAAAPPPFDWAQELPRVALRPPVFWARLRRAHSPAAGATGWRYDHLRVVLASPGAQVALLAVADDLANGELPALTDWLAVSLLVALREPWGRSATGDSGPPPPPRRWDAGGAGAGRPS